MATTPLIEVTSIAAQKIEEVLNEQSDGHTMLRVIATPGPEGGLQYALGSEDQVNDDDVVIDTDTVKILIDSQSAPLIEGSQIDYVDSLMRSGFVISNPNVAGGCGGGGCGCGGGGGNAGGCGGGGGNAGGCGRGACGCGGH